MVPAPQVYGPGACAQHLRNFTTGPGGQRLAPSNFERDIFPLPLLQEPFVKGLSRRSRKRQEQRNLPVRVRNEGAACLNWLAGFKQNSDAPSLSPGTSVGGMQGEVLDRIQDLAETMESDALINSEAAFTELLRGRSEYTLGDSTTLAPFKLESVSLPGCLADCKPIGQLVDDDSRRYLEERERMVKTDEEMKEYPPEDITPYNDPSLINRPRLYHQFVKKLMGIDFLYWTRRPKSRVGVFFVWKSDGKSIRMIRLLMLGGPTECSVSHLESSFALPRASAVPR